MLKIRRHCRDDIKYRVKRLNDSNINKFIGDNLGIGTTTIKQKEWFDNYEKSKDKHFFTICDGDISIGWMGLSNINKRNKNADLFLAIGNIDYHGKGFGRQSILWLIEYGFNKLHLHKINLGVVEENIPAVKLYKSVGFEIEGKMKDEVFYNGRFCNFLSMAIFNKNG